MLACMQPQSAGPLDEWARGYCKTSSVCSDVDNRKIPGQSACMLLCALCPLCRYAHYSSADDDCGLFSVCPLPLASINHPGEQHYSLELHNESAYCAQAECEVHGAQLEAQQAQQTHESAGGGGGGGGGGGASAGHLDWVRWIHHSRPQACAVSGREMSQVIIDDGPACGHAEHGIFTLVEGEATTYAHTVRACLKRCARCARCRHLTVAPNLGHCLWHYKCAPSPTGACGFRSGAVSRDATASRLQVVALVFFGKHASDMESSRALPVGGNASVGLITRAHSKWVANLIDANPHALFDVFMHSWSPDVAEAIDATWGPLLVRRQHEPTRYSDRVTGALAYQCERSELVRCARTASQLLSVFKALALKREHELSTGLRYDFVIVSRHDVSIMRPHRIPKAIYAAAAANESQVWFPASCGQSTCTPTDPTLVPKGCAVDGRRCLTTDPSFKRSSHAGAKLGIAPVLFDVLFAGSSAAVDRMGEGVHGYHAMARAILDAGERFTHSHLMWPYQAMRSGLRARWDLIDDRHLTFTRHEAAFAPKCFTSANLTLSGRTSAALHPGMEDACPYDAVLVCPSEAAQQLRDCVA